MQTGARLRTASLLGLLALTVLVLVAAGDHNTLGVAVAPQSWEEAAGEPRQPQPVAAAEASRAMLAAVPTSDTEQIEQQTGGGQSVALQRRLDAEQDGPVRQRPRLVYPPATPGPAPAAVIRPPVAPESLRVPILMYHHIADTPPGADAVRRDLSVSPAAFAQQMDALRRDGYETISLGDLIDALAGTRSLPPKPIILTFDDGYADNYQFAFPILRQRGLTGTFFILTDVVGHGEYVTWDQIIEMSQAGMSIEPHGRTHLDVTAISADQAMAQMAGSKAALEAKLGKPARFFCFPSGRYNLQAIAALKAAGYSGAVTTNYGAVHSPAGSFELQRVRMRGSDTLDIFTYKVASTR